MPITLAPVVRIRARRVSGHLKDKIQYIVSIDCGDRVFYPMPHEGYGSAADCTFLADARSWASHVAEGLALEVVETL